jgi:SpoIID/LytB domain protein
MSRNGRSLRIRADALRMALLRAGVAPGLHSMNCRLEDAGESIVFHDGRGFGHGVGLSQWGAQAKARRGASAEDILRFYYPGARIFRAY